MDVWDRSSKKLKSERLPIDTLVSAFGFGDVLGRPAVVLDPSRIAAQVISGIGFLGAGTIIFLRPRIIRGLTTAAGLWTVAAIGLAVGAGFYLAATASTAIVLLIPVNISAHTDLARLQSVLKKYAIASSEISLASGENEGEFLLKIHVGKDYDAQQLLALIAELKVINDGPTTAAHS